MASLLPIGLAVLRLINVTLGRETAIETVIALVVSFAAQITVDPEPLEVTGTVSLIVAEVHIFFIH